MAWENILTIVLCTAQMLGAVWFWYLAERAEQNIKALARDIDDQRAQMQRDFQEATLLWRYGAREEALDMFSGGVDKAIEILRK